MVGVANQSFTSIDQISWTEASTGSPDMELYAVTYGDGLFVAGGQDGAGGLVITSADGSTWSEPIRVPEKVWDLAWGNGRFALVGVGGMLYTSDDGTTWTERDSGTLDTLYRVRHLGDTFFILNGTQAIESDDGEVWASRELGVFLKDIIYTGKTHIGVSALGPIYTSDDRAEWTSVFDNDSIEWEAAAVSGR